MRTREIARPEWASFLEATSHDLVNRPVRLKVEGSDLGDQTLANCLPLVGLSVAGKGRQDQDIEITVSGPAGQGNLTHVVDHAEHLYVEEDEAGNVQVLDIEGPTRVKTLVFFTGWEALPGTI